MPLAPAYRLTIFAPRSQDPTETTVLTPVGGAWHSDPFRVTTLPNFAGYKPYLGIPQSKGDKVDPFGHTLQEGQLVFPVLDAAKTPGSNAARWASQFLGDASGAWRLVGCKASSQESLDGGVTWTDFFTGRIQREGLLNKTGLGLTVRTLVEDLKTPIFGTAPHRSITYAAQTSIHPVGSLVAYGTIAAVAPLLGTIQTQGGFTGFVVDPGAQGRARQDDVITGALAAAIASPVQTTGVVNVAGVAVPVITGYQPNFASPVRCHIVRNDTGAHGDFLVGAAFSDDNVAAALQAGTLTTPIGKRLWALILQALPDSSDPMYLVMPPAGTSVTAYVYIPQVVSQANPLIIGDVAPAQLISDCASGYFAELWQEQDKELGLLPPGRSIGDPIFSVPVYAAPPTTAGITVTGIQPVSTTALVINVTTGVTLPAGTPITIPSQTGTFALAATTVLSSGANTIQISPALNAPSVNGETITVYLRPGWSTLAADSSIPKIRGLRTDSQGIAFKDYLTELGPQCNLGAWFNGSGQLAPIDYRLPASLVGVLPLTDADLIAEGQELQWDHDRSQTVSRVNAKIHYDYLVPLSGSIYTSGPQAFPAIQSIDVPVPIFGTGTADFGDQPQQVDATGYRFTAGELNIVGSGFIFPKQTILSSAIAQQVYLWLAPYARGGSKVTIQLGRTPNTFDLQPGDLRIATLSVLPDPYTLLRGGARLLRCIERTVKGMTVSATMLDCGAAVTSAVPTVGSPALGADPLHQITVAITLNASSDPVDVQYNVTPSGVTTRPADNDAGWTLLKRITSSQTLTISALPAGYNVWPRARSVPHASQPPRLPSGWAYPAGTQFIGLTAISPPTALTVSLISAVSAQLNWTTGDPNEPAQIYLGPHGGTLSPVQMVPVGQTQYVLPPVLSPSTQYDVAVAMIDSSGGLSTQATATFTTTNTAPTCAGPGGLVVLSNV